VVACVLPSRSASDARAGGTRLDQQRSDGAILDGPEIDVVDQGDVDTCQPEPQVRMLE